MSSKTKAKKAAPGSAAGVLLGAPAITIKQRDAQGNLVDRTFELTPYDDLPRRVRREIRNALFKAAPDADAATGKADVYTSAYEAGVIVLRAAGAIIDPNDDTLPADVADETDQRIMLAGLRVFGDMNKAGGDGKNAPAAAEAETETTTG
jgi:hypothetical protein